MKNLTRHIEPMVWPSLFMMVMAVISLFLDQSAAYVTGATLLLVVASYALLLLSPRTVMYVICLINKRRRMVQLWDYEGKRYVSLAHHRGGETWQCRTNWVWQQGECLLLPNGVVDSHSVSSYVKFWAPTDPQQRITMMLTWDLNRLDSLLQKPDGSNRTMEIMELHDLMEYEWKKQP